MKVPRAIALAPLPSDGARPDESLRHRVDFLFRIRAGSGQARLHRLILAYRTGQEPSPCPTR
jgi:hypothetical protein